METGFSFCFAEVLSVLRSREKNMNGKGTGGVPVTLEQKRKVWRNKGEGRAVITYFG